MEGSPSSCEEPRAFGACLNGFWQELRGAPFRDNAFTESDWMRHITWRRYVPEPHTLGIVALSLAPVWLWGVLVALILGLYVTFAEPAGAPKLSDQGDLITAFTLTSFALSLLTLFKTTSSYSRWWEARTLWGSAYITVRSIMRLSIHFVGRSNPELIPCLYRWTVALLPALATLLRGKPHYLQDHLAKTGIMGETELAWLAGRGLPPIAALQVLSALLDRAEGLSDFERQQLEALFSHFDTITGGCERILRQPIPYAWSRHTLRWLIVYLTFLPIPFWNFYGWWTLPVMAVLGFLLCGLENIGAQIEEPHRVLPLNQICAGALRALRLMVEDQAGAAAMAVAAAGDGPSPACAPPADNKAPPPVSAVRSSGSSKQGGWRRPYPAADSAQSAAALAAAVELSAPNGAAPS